MPTLTPTAHFAQVICDFTSSATAIAAGAPALAALQRRSMTTTADLTHPGITFRCTDGDANGSASWVDLGLTLTLEAQLGTETGQTTREAAHTLFKSITALLADTDDAHNAWAAWIATLTDEQKDGWSLQTLWPQGTTSETTDDKNLLTLTASYTLGAYWNP